MGTRVLATSMPGGLAHGLDRDAMQSFPTEGVTDECSGRDGVDHAVPVQVNSLTRATSAGHIKEAEE